MMEISQKPAKRLQPKPETTPRSHPNQCRTNRDCGPSLACAGDGSGYRKCVNPCDRARCGANSECQVVNNRPQCSCADKHVGNPNTALGCTKVECEKNTDCSGDKICQVINNRCVDACSQISCGRGTCSADNHQPSCRCEPGLRMALRIFWKRSMPRSWTVSS